jgi:hypothetical protein
MTQIALLYNPETLTKSTLRLFQKGCLRKIKAQGITRNDHIRNQDTKEKIGDKLNIVTTDTQKRTPEIRTRHMIGGNQIFKHCAIRTSTRPKKTGNTVNRWIDNIYSDGEELTAEVIEAAWLAAANRNEWWYHI